MDDNVILATHIFHLEFYISLDSFTDVISVTLIIAKGKISYHKAKREILI